MARTFALIAPVPYVLHQVSCCYVTIPNAPKYYETLLKGPIGWIGIVHCKKSRHHFVARIFALIAPVHRVLHRVSCSYETIPNELKHYEMYKNMSVGSKGMDRVHSLQKIPTRLRGTYFCINYTSSARFAPSFMQ